METQLLFFSHRHFLFCLLTFRPSTNRLLPRFHTVFSHRGTSQISHVSAKLFFSVWNMPRWKIVTLAVDFRQTVFTVCHRKKLIDECCHGLGFLVIISCFPVHPDWFHLCSVTSINTPVFSHFVSLLLYLVSCVLKMSESVLIH